MNDRFPSTKTVSLKLKVFVEGNLSFVEPPWQPFKLSFLNCQNGLFSQSSIDKYSNSALCKVRTAEPCLKKHTLFIVLLIGTTDIIFWRSSC